MWRYRKLYPFAQGHNFITNHCISPYMAERIYFLISNDEIFVWFASKILFSFDFWFYFFSTVTIYANLSIHRTKRIFFSLCYCEHQFFISFLFFSNENGFISVYNFVNFDLFTISLIKILCQHFDHFYFVFDGNFFSSLIKYKFHLIIAFVSVWILFSIG